MDQGGESKVHLVKDQSWKIPEQDGGFDGENHCS